MPTLLARSTDARRDDREDAVSQVMCDGAWCGWCCLVVGRPNHREDCPFGGTFHVALDRFHFAVWKLWRRHVRAWFYRTTR